MRKLISLALALMMVFAFSATALAAGEGEGTKQTDPVNPGQTLDGVNNNGKGNSDDGHTTIGIVSTTAKTTIDPATGEIQSSQLEFEVPLYVVLAVGKNLVDTNGNAIPNTKLGAKGEGSVVCPEGYYIKGTSNTAPIGVKTLTFKCLTSGGWKTTGVTSDSGNVTGAKTMALKIGADYIPSINNGSSAMLYSAALDTTPAGGTAAFNNSSLFYKTPGTPTSGPKAIGTTPLELPIIARVNQASITDQDVTKAFQVVYTIGLVDENTDPSAPNSFLDAAIFTYLGSDLVSSRLG